MPAPSLYSPNEGNYQIAKGILSFKREGTPNFVDLGNAPEIEFTPEVETLPHYSSRTGVRTKDLEIILEKSGTVRVVLDEFTARNLQLVLLGAINEQGPDGPEIDIFTANTVNGELMFIAQNEVGPRTNYHFYNVSFIPGSSISLISDEWGRIEANASALLAGAGHEKAGKVGRMWISNIEGYGSPS